MRINSALLTNCKVKTAFTGCGHGFAGIVILDHNFATPRNAANKNNVPNLSMQIVNCNIEN
jgi:hypothetical protein